MDQLKVTLRHLKRLHFWILCPLTALIGIAFWYLAVGKINEEKEKNLSDISSKYSAAQGVLSQSPHPNTDVAKEMDNLILKTRTEIAEAWQNKVVQQEKVLKWPPLPAEFLRTVEPLRPIERAVPVKKEGENISAEELILLSDRQTYRDYIEKELPKLAQLAGSRWVVGFGDERAMRRDDQKNTLVVWNPDNQLNIRKKHFEWKKSGPGARSDGTPTTLEVLYAQEDMWVLRHLMQIVSRTNEGATTRHSAAIRKILSIDIGKAAVESKVTVETLADDKEKKSSAPTRAGPADASVAPDPAEGRYVDKNYEPLSAEVLRNVMQNGVESPEQAYLAVAKRVPVRLRVSMDQRRINKLLVECANSELTVEVRQLLVNKDYKGGGRRAAAGGFGGNGGPERGFSASALGRPNAKSSGLDTNFPYDLDVEIYGIVSIYNPVDNAALGLVDEEETASTLGLPTSTSR